ncbi:MAG: hypothetical protein ACP5F3_07615, partial [Candidatus Syntrophosphaera sp.]
HYFNNLSIQKTPGSHVTLHSAIQVLGNMEIFSGVLDSNGENIYVGGNWTQYGGPGCFDESAGTLAQVIFNGTGDQTISGTEEFNHIWNNISGGGLVIGPGADVSASQYYHFDHGLWIEAGGSFEAELVDIYGYDSFIGEFTVHGYLGLTLAPDQDANIGGTVTIGSEGEFHIHGGQSPCIVNDGGSVSCNGTLYFHDIGVEVWNDGNLLMNGGDLYVAGGLWVYNQYSMLYGGTVHFVGGGDCAFLPPTTGFTGLSLEKASINDVVTVNNRDIGLMGDLVIGTGQLHMNGLDLMIGGDAQISGRLEMEGGDLRLGAGSAFDVLSGGKLVLEGTASDLSYVTRSAASTGYYSLNVHDGGGIGAAYTVFEYMGTQGVNVHPGAWVYDDCFLHCVFRNGADAGTLLKLDNSQNILLYGVNFPYNDWGGIINVSKATDEGNVYMVMATGSFSGAAHESDPYGRIDWGTQI